MWTEYRSRDGESISESGICRHRRNRSFLYGNTAVDRSLPWKDWVEQFCKGYEHAKEEGGKIGLQVFFGWESGYHGTEFLIMA